MSEAAVAGFGEELGKEHGEERAWGATALWHRAHEELVRLAATRAGLDYEEGRWLLRAERSGVHVRLGYGSFREYVERLFGYSSRLVQEKLRVADALEGLPVLSAELEQGRTSFSAVRELSRVATRATERAWLEAARDRSIREIEGLVSGQKPGNLPEDAPDARAKRHVLRLEVSGEAFATFREAMAKMRHQAGEALDDDAAVLLLCRRALEGPRDEGRSSYQVALTVCEHCRRGMQQGRGELVEVSAEIVEMTECDGQNVGHVGETEHAHVGETGRAHVGETGRAHVGAALPRAKQTIPPGLRRRVMRRDGGCCRVPGCQQAVFVDVHHLDLRSEGGGNTLENLVTLCAAHHRATHLGQLVVEGSASGVLTFRHRGRDAVRCFARPAQRRDFCESVPRADPDGLPRDGDQAGARSSAWELDRKSRAAHAANAPRARTRLGRPQRLGRRGGGRQGGAPGERIAPLPSTTPPTPLAIARTRAWRGAGRPNLPAHLRLSPSRASISRTG